MTETRSDTIEKTLKLLKTLYEQEGLSQGVIEKIGVKPQWNCIIGTDEQCGIAINFTGKHSVYRSKTDAAELKSLIGKNLFDVAEKNIGSSDVWKRSIGIAAMSALSQPLLGHVLLKKRRFRAQHWMDFQGGEGRGNRLADFVRPDDAVAIVGYGGIVRKIMDSCKEIHVTEMRQKEIFQSIIIAEDVQYGPQKVSLHPEWENKEVLSNADVVIITGSSLVNSTFDELMSYTTNARLVGMYGPSASIIPDILFKKGVDFISSFRITDQIKFEDDMINDIDMEIALKEHQTAYVCRVLPENMKSDANRFDNTAKTEFAPIYPVIAQQIVDRCGVKDGFCIDVGSGPASLAMALAKITDLTIYALDISEEMHRIAKENIEAEGLAGKVIPMLGDIQEMPFGNDSIDLIISRGSMFFWQDKVEAFKEVYRVLKPNGMAYIGGGFGTAMLKEKVTEEMRKKDPNWENATKKRFERSNAIELEEVMQESKIPNYRIIHDSSGLWISIKK